MDPRLHQLRDSLLEGNTTRTIELGTGLLSSGVSAETIVLESVESAMEALDQKCTAEHFNLLEIMLTGRAVVACMKVLFPAGTPSAAVRAVIVLASLRGDVHDLGKNIFKSVCLAHGYRVIDCGKNCRMETLREQVDSAGAHVVGVSGLISSVVPRVRRLRKEFEASGRSDLLLLAGGAALRQLPAESLGVDFVARHAFDGVRFLNSRFPSVPH